jgi:hypothetical protein
MREIDLVQAMTGWITLSYTAAQWWLTVTSALVVATYLAAKHIPGWLFAIVLLLYALTSFSAVFEVGTYGDLAVDYGRRLTDFRAATHIQPAQIGAAPEVGAYNGLVNDAVFLLGTFSAAAFSFLHWRAARKR